MDTFLKNILMRVEKYCTKNVKDKNMHSDFKKSNLARVLQFYCHFDK